MSDKMVLNFGAEIRREFKVTHLDYKFAIGTSFMMVSMF